MDLTATKAFRYAGKALKPGDHFTASRGDGRVLRAIGKASPRAMPQEPAREPDPDPVGSAPADPEPGDETKPAKPARSRYKRRDIRAED